jgi:hypothetical protein
MANKLQLLVSSSMEIRDYASIVSAIVAIFAAIVAWVAISRQTRTQSWVANHDGAMALRSKPARRGL